MWNLETNDEYEKRVQKWPKKHRRELLAMHSNLDTLHKALNEGAPLEQVQHFGFIHCNEPNGIMLIDQKGAGSGARQTRLYIYPDAASKTVHLITVGFKERHAQNADIQYATKYVGALKQN